MDKILGVLGGVPSTKPRNDDDFADRMVYKTTVGMFILFAIIISTKQYVGEPIQCWVPAEFTGNQEEYTNNYCWIKNTYYLPYEKNIPKEHEAEKRKIIPYYQWAPLILGVQALICYLPIILWRYLNKKSGIDVNAIVEAGEKFTNAEAAENRETTLRFMTKLMDRYLANQRDVPTSCTLSLKHVFSRTCFKWCGRKRGNYLTTLYLFSKFLLLVSVLSQLFALNFFLGQDFHLYGFDAIGSMFAGEDQAASDRFPRVTMCDFKVRRLGNVQRYTVQCVLPINLFNEKIYLFIWFWLTFTAIVMSFSIVNWMFRFFYSGDRKGYVKKHLSLVEKISDHEQRVLSKFVDDYLKQDGIFVLRMVGHNTNAITATEFVCQLWYNYRTKPFVEKAENAESV